MSRKVSIFVKSQFVALHRWKDAPEDIAFLRDYHRHVFHVKVSLSVKHNDRDIEFFQFKRLLDAYLAQHYVDQKFDQSCEMIAICILDHFEAIHAVEVSEDGENGAEVVYTHRLP